LAQQQQQQQQQQEQQKKWQKTFQKRSSVKDLDIFGPIWPTQS